MDRVFSIFGKLVLVLLVVGVLVAGGYYLGKKYTLFQKVPNQTSTSPVPTSATQSGSIISPTVNPQATGRFAVSAGGKSPFVAYTLSGVAGWTPTKTSDSVSDKLILTKGNYQITILQAALGGGGCTFPGDTPAEMSVVLTNPVMQITLLDGTMLKRGQADSGTNPGKATYAVCQKGQNNAYGSITTFGVINYVVPLNPDTETVAEMDAMVGSLQKQ